MKYELEIESDNCFKVRKIMQVELWNSNQVFDELCDLKRYLTDFLELPCSINEAEDRIAAAPMNSWISFE